jgi:hypothetical protein
VLADEVVRSEPGFREILPALGRRSVHSTGKAAHLLGWQSRPAAETALDAARSILAWRAA